MVVIPAAMMAGPRDEFDVSNSLCKPPAVLPCGPEGAIHVRINGVVVTWVVAIDPPGVRFPLNAFDFLVSRGDR